MLKINDMHQKKKFNATPMTCNEKLTLKNKICNVKN